MAITHDLQYSIWQILKRSHEGSHNTRADRNKILSKFAEDLIKTGNRLRHINGLKPKHIASVVERWQREGLTSGTLKNRLAALRFLAEKIGKANIMPTNEALHIPSRTSTPKINRAITNPDFSAIDNPYILISLQLQRVFGLRREESLKIRPHLADQKDLLILQPTWCKGGRGRNVPIRTEEQRYWLEQAKQLVARGDSLIPPNEKYIRQRNRYDKQAAHAGIRNPHGMRHAYAQTRYKELTGWEAPINGGPTFKELTSEQKTMDHEARMIITSELGHGRKFVTRNYLDR